MKFGLNDKVIQSIQQLLEQNFLVDKAFIFGSRAKGSYKEGSDIDLALKGDITAKDVLDLYGKFEALNLPYKFDLVNYSSINEPALKEHIDNVGVEFYSRWKEYRFSDFVEINPVMRLDSTKEYPFVEMKDLHNGSRYCSPSTQRRLSGGARFQNYDTLFARITPCLENGKICQVRNLKNDVGFGSTEFLIFRGKQGISDNDFVFYLSRWDEVRGFAESNFEGTSGRQRVQKNCLDKLKLELPCLQEQRNITRTLVSIDDKIDLLHRQNKTLEQLAETLFRQWFVEEADESWETVKIKDVALINANTIGKNYKYSTIEYLDTGAITRGIIQCFESYNIKEAPGRAQRIVKEGDIVYSLVRPIQRHYGILQNLNNNTIVSTGFCVISCETISPYFIYLLLTQDENVEYFDTVAEGSTSAYPSLRPSDIADFEFKMPPSDMLELFAKIAEDSWCKIRSNTTQIRTLTQLRDTLLPKLMSGEVRVNLTAAPSTHSTESKKASVGQ